MYFFKNSQLQNICISSVLYKIYKICFYLKPVILVAKEETCRSLLLALHILKPLFGTCTGAGRLRRNRLMEPHGSSSSAYLGHSAGTLRGGMPRVPQLSPLLVRLSSGKIEWQTMSGGYDHRVLIQTTRGEGEAGHAYSNEKQSDTKVLGKK